MVEYGDNLNNKTLIYPFSLNCFIKCYQRNKVRGLKLDRQNSSTLVSANDNEKIRVLFGYIN